MGLPRLLVVLLLGLLQSAKSAPESLAAIPGDAVFAHVETLASDEFEGREAGTPGCDRAAEYLAGRLKGWRLKGAGPGGAYFQEFKAPKKTRNVLAWVEGSDLKRRREFVVIGAHYDHIGLTRRGEDRVNNGADDNASGTAAVLEIARAFAELKAEERPPRSLLFCWWSAEEKGLLGSKHFVRNPTVDLRSIVAYLNLDMVGRNADDRIDIEGTGCSPDLRTVFDRINGSRKIFERINYEVEEVKADTDHFPFFESGVPAVEFFSGYHADYHQPGDEAPKVSRAKLERVARFVALSAWELANDGKRPEFRDPRKRR